MGFFIRLLATLLGLWAADKWLAGFSVEGGWQGYLIATLILVLLNLLVRPILKLISLPLIIITLGLFTIVINAVILWLASQFTGYIAIDGLISLLWATVIISAINIVVHWFK